MFKDVCVSKANNVKFVALLHKNEIFILFYFIRDSAKSKAH